MLYIPTEEVIIGQASGYGQRPSRVAGAEMWRRFRDGCRAVAFCVAYNALFGLAIVLTILGLAAAASLVAAVGVPRESAADVFSLGPVLLFGLFWVFYLRKAHIDPFGDGGD